MPHSRLPLLPRPSLPSSYGHQLTLLQPSSGGPASPNATAPPGNPTLMNGSHFFLPSGIGLTDGDLQAVTQRVPLRMATFVGTAPKLQHRSIVAISYGPVSKPSGPSASEVVWTVHHQAGKAVAVAIAASSPPDKSSSSDAVCSRHFIAACMLRSRTAIANLYWPQD